MKIVKALIFSFSVGESQFVYTMLVTDVWQFTVAIVIFLNRQDWHSIAGTSFKCHLSAYVESKLRDSQQFFRIQSLCVRWPLLVENTILLILLRL